MVNNMWKPPRREKGDNPWTSKVVIDTKHNTRKPYDMAYNKKNETINTHYL